MLSVLLLLHVQVLASAHTPPSECEELRLENQRLRELLEQLSARSKDVAVRWSHRDTQRTHARTDFWPLSDSHRGGHQELPKAEARGIARLGEGPRALRGAARTLLRTEGIVVAQGEDNTNECPVGSAVMCSTDECDKAGAILGFDLYETYFQSDFPKGCYLYAGYVFFNTHPVGSADPNARPLCYVRTTAPTPTPTRIGDTISPTAMEGAKSEYSVVCIADDVTHLTAAVVFGSSVQWHAVDRSLV
jgi:hypothetical protein